MASFELSAASGHYFVRYRFAGRSFKRSLKTNVLREARAAVARVEETISLVERGILEAPKGDPTAFFLSNGKATEPEKPLELLSLSSLFTKYKASLPDHAKETSTLETERTHIKHFRKYLPVSKPAVSITTNDVQQYVNKQLKRKVNGRYISPDTAKREIDTLRSIFNWANKQQLISCQPPTIGLVFPKRDEKPPFMTRAEIERIIERGGLSDAETKELWDALYLTIPEVHEVLDLVKTQARYPFIYPMFAFVAFTGARRSEMMRSRIDDFDLGQGTVLIRERKRSRIRSTTFRRVDLPSVLVEIISDWFREHPGGQQTFCHDFGIVRNDWKRGLTRDQARTQFEKAIRGTKWSVIRGFHVFRHSYASNLAAAGVDQRIIDKHMGHQTEEMRKRYQHLTPAVCRKAVEVLAS